MNRTFQPFTLKTSDGKTFQSEKIMGSALINKDLITSLNIRFPAYLSNLFWDTFSNTILQSKALPSCEPDIQFGYSLYDDWNYGDANTLLVRISTRALRLKGRGRRSNQFKRDQVDALAKYKRNYIRLLSKHIRESFISQE